MVTLAPARRWRVPFSKTVPSRLTRARERPARCPHAAPDGGGVTASGDHRRSAPASSHAHRRRRSAVSPVPASTPAHRSQIASAAGGIHGAGSVVCHKPSCAGREAPAHGVQHARRAVDRAAGGQIGDRVGQHLTGAARESTSSRFPDPSCEFQWSMTSTRWLPTHGSRRRTRRRSAALERESEASDNQLSDSWLPLGAGDEDPPVRRART